MSKKIWQVFRSKNIKDNKRVRVLLEVIQRIYDKNPEMQEVIDTLMIDVFYFDFSLLLSFL